MMRSEGQALLDFKTVHYRKPHGARAMYLNWLMLLLLVASYGLCAALVLFAEQVIRPRGSEVGELSAPSRLPKSTSSG